MIDLVVLNDFSDNGWKAKDRTSTRVTQTDSGGRWVVRKWAYWMREFEIPFNLMDQATYTEFREFIALRGGPTFGFLLWDASSFYAANQPIGTGDGATTSFQLTLTLSDSVRSLTKPITKPVPTGTAIPIQYRGVPGGFSTTVHTVKVAGTTLVEGTDYTISPSTGDLVFTAAPPSGHAIVWTGWYYTPVFFVGDELPLDLNSVYASVQPTLLEAFNE